MYLILRGYDISILAQPTIYYAIKYFTICQNKMIQPIKNS